MGILGVFGVHNCVSGCVLGILVRDEDIDNETDVRKDLSVRRSYVQSEAFWGIRHSYNITHTPSMYTRLS